MNKNYEKKDEYRSLQSSNIERKTGMREEASGMESMKMCLISLRPVQKQAIETDANELLLSCFFRTKGQSSEPLQDPGCANNPNLHFRKRGKKEKATFTELHKSLHREQTDRLD